MTDFWTAIIRRWQTRPVVMDFLLFGAVLVLGGSAALVAHWPLIKGPTLKLERAMVDGVVLETGANSESQLVQLVRERLRQQVTLKGDTESVRVTWAQLGATAQLSALKRVLEELGKNESSASRYYRRHFDGDMPSFDLPFTLDGAEAVEALVSIKEKFDRRPKDARFDFADDSVQPEKDGRRLDVYRSLEKISAALSAGSEAVSLVVDSIAPSICASTLKGIDVGAVAGFYETPYSRMRKDADRTHNLSLGASFLDGTIIPAGETVSFNDIVGDRSEARGFRYAPVIAAGKIVEGMGGGACQVASTLYAAAFFAGLSIEDRVPHSRPSSYIKLGLDATVSYPAKDLVIRNPLAYPVVIHFTVDDGQARAEIRAQERPFTVSLLRRVVTTRDYPVRVVDDSRILRGKEVITQRGIPGYTVRRYRIIERDKVAYRFQSYDRYPPTTEFVRRGTGDEAQVKAASGDVPKADTHKPYRASMSLRMVQGEGLWYEQNHD